MSLSVELTKLVKELLLILTAELILKRIDEDVCTSYVDYFKDMNVDTGTFICFLWFMLIHNNDLSNR